MNTLHSKYNFPWDAIRDFKSILGAHERQGCKLPLKTACDDSKSTTDSCDFVHLDATGHYFTFTKWLPKKLLPAKSLSSKKAAYFTLLPMIFNTM